MNPLRILAVACCLLLVLPLGASGKVPRPPGTAVEILVLFENGVSAPEVASLHDRAGGASTGRIDELNLERVSVSVAGSAVYLASPLVAAVSPHTDLHVMGARPKDPLVKLQWALGRVKAFDAWRIERGLDSEVTVAVVDTGIDPLHEDLEGRLVSGFDFINHDEQPSDDDGHGTHVAGIIGANSSNRIGIAGLSWGAKVMPIKTCTASGVCPLFETYAGTVDAVRRGASILNLSLGGEGACDTIAQTVFDWVRDRGALAVVAAGNSGSDGNPSITPANCANTLGVGAVDQRGRHAPFSSYGKFVDISAPGVEVWSTYPAFKSFGSGYIGYAPLSGTSMATPVVAGIAALVKARHPDWTPDQIEQRLIKTARDAGKKGRDAKFGKGIVDAFRALK